MRLEDEGRYVTGGSLESSEEPVTYSPSRKIRGLHHILEIYHLTDFYPVSAGPSARVAYHQNGRTMDEVVSKIESYCLDMKLGLSVTALPESNAIELSSKNGTGIETLRHLRLAYPEMYLGGEKPRRNYLTQ